MIGLKVAVALLTGALVLGGPVSPAWAKGNTKTATTLTEAKLRRIVRVQFDDDPATVFSKLLRRVDLIDPNVVEVRFDHAQSRTSGQMDVGSRRICMFADGRVLVEPIIVYDPPRAYAYTVDQNASTMSLPVSTIVLFYNFTAIDDGTELRVRAHFDPAVPGTGPIIEPVLTGTLRRTFQTAASTFGGTYLGDEKP